MSTVLRLVYTFFAGTPITRGLTIAGLVLFGASLLTVTYLPQTAYLLAFALVGQLALFLGSGLMPVMFGRMAQGHALRMMSLGRVKLLASALITVALVALPAGVITPIAYAAANNARLSDLSRYPGAVDFLVDTGILMYTSVALIAGWLYLIMWFNVSQRNLAGLAKSLFIILLVVIVPARELEDLSATIEWNLIQLAVIWTLFGAGFLWWPRIKRVLAGLRPNLRGSSTSGSDTLGKEVALILGTHNPWLLVGAMALPMVIATRAGMSNPGIWLFVLTIFSTVTGAMAGQAAWRSRALWLRRNVSRGELFAEVERCFWRHHAVVLGILLALMIGIGSYVRLPGELLAGGLPLLALGTLSSTYLGFMLTRGLRWPEIAIGAVVMLTLMSVALLLGANLVNLAPVFAIEALLLALVFVLRAVGRRRWSRIDWVECRAPRALSMRQA
jgi:hypothetical protein